MKNYPRKRYDPKREGNGSRYGGFIQWREMPSVSDAVTAGKMVRANAWQWAPEQCVSEQDDLAGKEEY